MKKTALIIALFAFGFSFGKTPNCEPLPKISLFSFSKDSQYVVTYAFALYDKGGNDACFGGINMGRTLYADSSIIEEGTQLYIDSTESSSSKWTGATSTYYRLVSGTSASTVSVNSSGVVNFVSCSN
ncbi:hypothetical protein [Flavobacterium sp. LAR06]|uniref:hypothetical protein n=1 Tax=Flavobacterium sp. LAR06 TaxID=3064897 RepID=UPI0035C16443